MREKRIAIFVDGANFWAACKHAGIIVDYDRVIEYYKQQGDVINCSYFTALPPKNEESKLRTFTTRLQYSGWHLITKDTKSLLSDDGVFRDKGNMDVELAVKAMMLIDKVTDFVLFSGDGDFRYLVEVLQSKMIHVTIVSHHKYVADALRRQADEFTTIEFLRKHIDRQPFKDDRPEREQARRNFLNE